MITQTIGIFRLAILSRVTRNGLALASFLCADTGIRAGRIYQSNHGQAKALGQAHQAQRFAITFRSWHTEVAIKLLLGVSALLMSDDDDRSTFQSRQPADDRWVVRKGAVAVQLLEVRTHGIDVLKGVGPLRVARKL